MKKKYLIFMLIIMLPFCAYSLEFEAGYYKGACVKVMILDNVGFEVFGSIDVSPGGGLSYLTYGISPLVIKVYDNDQLRIFITAEYQYVGIAGDPGSKETIYGLNIPRVEYHIPFFDNVWLRVLDLKVSYTKKQTRSWVGEESTSYISNINLFSGVMFSF